MSKRLHGINIRKLGSRLIVTILALVVLTALTAEAAHAKVQTSAGFHSHHQQTALPTNTVQTVDLDISVMVDGAGNRQFYPIEGWLHLVATGAGKMAGTFTDNYAGGKKYPSSATIAATKTDSRYTINSHAGAFTFDGNQSAVSIPAKFGNNFALLAAYPHQYTTVTYTTFTIVNTYSSDETVIAGTLTLTYDNINWIINNDPKHGVQSNLVVTSSPKQIIVPITHSGAFAPGADGILDTSLKINGATYVLAGTADGQGSFKGVTQPIGGKGDSTLSDWVATN